jgi:RNA polymerase sigma-70 factor (ECF subfamily)
LVDAAGRGDLLAWERLVRRYQESVYRVAYLIVRESELAEGATLSAFVRGYRALPSYDQDLGLLPWFIRITAGEARQQRRESGRPTSSSRPVERSDGPQVPSSPIAGMAGVAGLTTPEQEVITSAFDRLAEDDRLVIAARYLMGLDMTDAANALSIASGLVEGNLQTAVTHLRTRMTDAPAVESRPGSLTGLTDDRLATVAVSLALSELRWTPDLAPAVLDRISRDAVAYPEQFDRRPVATPPAPPPAPSGRSAQRTVGRLAVFGIMLALIVALVRFAATANATAASLAGSGRISTPPMSNITMHGTLASSGIAEAAASDAVEQGGRVLLVVTEAS